MTIDTGAARIFPSHAQVEEFLSVAETLLYYVRSLRSALAVGFGSPGFAGEASSSQSTSNALSVVAFEDSLVSQVGSSLPSGALVPGGGGGFVLVDGEEPSSQGGSIRDTRSESTPVLGCVLVGVGRTPPRLGSVLGVVGAEVAAHQSSRNEGIVSGIAVISGVVCRLLCDRDVRQLDGGGLRQQAGRDCLPFPLLVGQPASEVVGESRRPPRCEISTRAVQCSGRSPQPSGSGYRDRVVFPPSGSERLSSLLGLAVDRPVRDEFQREASSILLPCPGSPGGL